VAVLLWLHTLACWMACKTFEQHHTRALLRVLGPAFQLRHLHYAPILTVCTLLLIIVWWACVVGLFSWRRRRAEGRGAARRRRENNLAALHALDAIFTGRGAACNLSFVMPQPASGVLLPCHRLFLYGCRCRDFTGGHSSSAAATATAGQTLLRACAGWTSVRVVPFSSGAAPRNVVRRALLVPSAFSRACILLQPHGQDAMEDGDAARAGLTRAENSGCWLRATNNASISQAGTATVSSWSLHFVANRSRLLYLLDSSSSLYMSMTLMPAGFLSICWYPFRLPTTTFTWTDETSRARRATGWM